MLAILLGALDQTIVSVALPRMAQQLNGFDLLAWVVSGYLVASTVVTPIYGKLGDLYGRRKLLSVAILVFLVASVACALAQTMPQLVAARVLQGLGGGGLISIAQAIIADVVPLRERGRYQGYLSGVFAVASVAGPVIGGLFTHYLSWRWIFWINIPLGAAAFLASRRALAGLAGPAISGVRRRVDYPGAVLLTLGLTALLIPISRVGQGVAIADTSNVALLVVAIILILACLAWERRAAEPIIPLPLFRIRAVTLCCALLFFAFLQLIALAVLMPLRFQMVAGIAADSAAWRILPLTFTIPLGAFIAGRLMLHTGRYRPSQLIGVGVLPFALVALAFFDPSAVVATTFFLIVAGIALGMQFPSSLVAVQNAVPRQHIGIATAATAFFRSLGGAIGIAVLSAILFSTLREITPLASSTSGLDRGGDDMLRAMISSSLDAGSASSDSRDAFRAGAELAFRRLFLIAAAISLIPLALAWWVPEGSLRDRVE